MKRWDGRSVRGLPQRKPSKPLSKSICPSKGPVPPLGEVHLLGKWSSAASYAVSGTDKAIVRSAILVQDGQAAPSSQDEFGMVELASNTALLVVDVQKGFDEPYWGARNNPDAETNIRRLLENWREAKRPVFHVFHDSASPKSPLRPDGPGNAPKPEAEPGTGEGVYRKTVNSAFIGTSLEADLRNAGIGTLVVVGLTTNHCISTTVRMAGNFGFEVYVVSDATATFDRQGIDGRNRPAAEVHAAALSDLHGEFATVIDTASLISVPAI